MESSKLYNGRYSKLKELDRSPFSVVYLAEQVPMPSLERMASDENANPNRSVVRPEPSGDGKNDNLVVMKKITPWGPNAAFQEKTVKTEIEFLTRLAENRHTARIFDSFKQQGSTYIVVEFLPVGLEDLIYKAPKLTANDVRHIAKETLTALAYFHSRRILHRDVKPQNIMLSRTGELKLIDFGLMRDVKGETTMTPNVATLWYKAPEVLYGSTSYGEAIDLWAVGCVIAEMVLKAPLFKGNSQIDQLAKIFGIVGSPTEEVWPGVTDLPNFFPIEGGSNTLGDILAGVDPNLVSLLSSLLTLNPSARPTAEQALRHPYFDTPVDIPSLSFRGLIRERMETALKIARRKN